MSRVYANQPSKEERLAKNEESKMVIKLDVAEEENKDGEKAEESKESKDGEEGFVIVDDSYLDGVAQEVIPLSKTSDFTRVNPLTASTDFKHFNAMFSNFLIGPQFLPRHKELNVK